jgi:AraC-like DNA-binding protein
VRTGFGTTQELDRAFKKLAGQSPEAFRRRHQKTIKRTR